MKNKKSGLSKKQKLELRKAAISICHAAKIIARKEAIRNDATRDNQRD